MEEHSDVRLSLEDFARQRLQADLVEAERMAERTQKVLRLFRQTGELVHAGEIGRHQQTHEKAKLVTSQSRRFLNQLGLDSPGEKGRR